METYFPLGKTLIVLVRKSLMLLLMKPSLLQREPVFHYWKSIFSIVETNAIASNSYSLSTDGNFGDFSKGNSYYFYWLKHRLQSFLARNAFSETFLLLYDLSLNLNSGTWRYRTSLITDENLDANLCEERFKILPVWVQYFQENI